MPLRAGSLGTFGPNQAAFRAFEVRLPGCQSVDKTHPGSARHVPASASLCLRRGRDEQWHLHWFVHRLGQGDLRSGVGGQVLEVRCWRSGVGGHPPPKGQQRVPSVSVTPGGQTDPCLPGQVSLSREGLRGSAEQLGAMQRWFTCWRDGWLVCKPLAPDRNSQTCSKGTPRPQPTVIMHPSQLDYNRRGSSLGRKEAKTRLKSMYYVKRWWDRSFLCWYRATIRIPSFPP
jgi:hypothetical protein